VPVTCRMLVVGGTGRVAHATQPLDWQAGIVSDPPADHPNDASLRPTSHRSTQNPEEVRAYWTAERIAKMSSDAIESKALSAAIVGLPEDEAKRKVEEAGRTWVVERNQLVTADRRPLRVRVWLSEGIVAESIGG
jgi:hypothetical protein